MMKQLTCEMCGSTDLIKKDGVFVCQSCGTKYSIEEAKKMMVEGTVNVTGTVKLDTSDELANLYQIARRAKDEDNGENAAKYYDMILVKDPTSWEASFYVVYFKAINCKIAQIASAGNSIANCIHTVLSLIKDHVQGGDEQIKAVQEVAARCTLISGVLCNGAKTHFFNIDRSIRLNYHDEFFENCLSATAIMYTLGDEVDSIFKDFEELHSVAVAAWKEGNAHNKEYLLKYNISSQVSQDLIMKYAGKIQKYDSSYETPTFNDAGCYIATAVYGSYNCPQVWTLRRYRDYTLAKSWYGRAFIHIYYAISPTLVKWFGNTSWFKKMWKGPLDQLVKKLQGQGIEDSPYEDKPW